MRKQKQTTEGDRLERDALNEERENLIATCEGDSFGSLQNKKKTYNKYLFLKL